MALCGLFIGLLAAVVRLVSIADAYDVYVDEFFYVLMGEQVSAGAIPPISDEGPFLVHPPGYFLWEAAGLSSIGGSLNDFDQVFALRSVQQLLAAASAVLIFLIVRRASGMVPGLIGGLLFAVDPFILRQNGRILLETATLAAVLTGYWLLARHMQGGACLIRYPALAGTCFGVAILTKDMAAGVTILPLLLLFVSDLDATITRGLSGWVLPRKHILIAIGCSTVPYAVFATWCAIQGFLPDLWEAKTSGVQRLLGNDVTTGYNSGEGPALLEIVSGLLHQFVASYVILFVGSLIALWLMVRPATALERLIGLFGVCGALMTAYGMIFGTSEEHLFYFAMVPAVMNLTVGTARILRVGPQLLLTKGKLLPRLVGAALLVVLLIDGQSWLNIRTNPDRAQLDQVEWVQAHVPAGSSIAWTVGQTKYALAGQPYNLIVLDNEQSMRSYGSFYLIIFGKELDQGYTYTTPDDVAFWMSRADEVFREDSRSYGVISVYQVWDPSRW